ncbi:MAG: hypothetical protein Q9M40_03495 [Sulfurimonas sp.]|nr:hypothetical protein [Sulfurimonas sp.]
MYFIDVQGTLISDIDKSPIAGSIAFIEYLNAQNIPYMIVTNNTKKPSKVFFEYLNSIGFDISFDKYLDPLMLLETKVAKNAVAAYGAPEFLATLESMGYFLDFVKPQDCSYCY